MSRAAKAFMRKVESGRADFWKAGRPRLARLDLELTERCNNACVHCSIGLPAGDDDARRRESTTAEITNILAEAASLGCLSIRFTGGEPLLREDFEEIYLAARKLGLRVRIFTNATLVTPRLAAVLKKFPPLEKMEVSVYGMTSGTSEKVTGNPGAHEASRRGIGLLSGHGIPFVLKGVVLPETKGEMDRFESWALDNSGAAVRPSYAALFDLRSRRDNGAKDDRIRKLRVGPREYVELESRLRESHADELRGFVASFAGTTGDRLFGCLADTGSIDAYGRFQVCLLLRHPETLFDLKKGSLRNAVEEFLPKIREMRTSDPAYLERCGRCFLKALCLQCPARSWAEHGTLDTPVEYFCGITHAQAASIGVIKEGEKAWAVADWRARVERLMASPKGRGTARTEGREEC